MRLVAESGLWTTGPVVPPPPGVAVVEVDGAVFEWDVLALTEPPRVTFTDVAAADWLWHVVGEPGHVALLEAGAAPEDGRGRDVDAVLAAAAVAPLRRLAVGHWLRRWWPASARDGIVALDAVVLDGELAVLTAALQDYLAEPVYDAELTSLLGPHRAALAALAARDPRIADLAARCAELADDVGVPLPVEVAEPGRSRADYALAAGARGNAVGEQSIARGVGSVQWTAVPPACFDAADGTVDWSIEVSGREAVAAVRVAASAPVAGIAVGLRSGELRAEGVLDADGRATLPLLDAHDRPVPEDVAWNHDWPPTTVTIGADAVDSADPAGAAELRRRLRDFARARLAAPGPDAYLAEVLAAEADY